jgi:multidrug resistance efflux pump
MLLHHLEKSVQSNCENRRAKGLVVGIPFWPRLGAPFALMPRNVVSEEFTKVVQSVPVRI